MRRILVYGSTGERSESLHASVRRLALEKRRMSSSSAESRLPLSTLGTYALPGISTGFMSGLIAMYLLKFSTDVLLIAPAVMGFLFGLSRVWDAVSDPLAGYWSDRTRTRFGRRRPWMFASALPISLLFFALWTPPESLSSTELVVWMGAAILLFWTAQTAFGIPHLALGAELTLDYHDRSRVFAGRLILDFVGAILAALAMFMLESARDVRAAAGTVAFFGAFASVCLICFSTARMRERPSYQGRAAKASWRAFGDVFRNPHARLLVVIFFLDQLGFSAVVTMLPYASEYVLEESGMTGIFIASAMGAALLAIPVWIPLSRRYGKRNPWLFAAAIKAVGYGVMFLLQPGDWVLIIGLIIVVGAMQGSSGILGPSIQSDVIDWDESRTGERKEGSYFAVWNLLTKTAAGVAIILSGSLLQISGFVPNVAQSETALWTIRILFALIPMGFSVLVCILLLRFRLDEREYVKIRAEIDRRESDARPDPEQAT